MIRRYEALVMAVPEITQEEVKNLETEFGRIAQKSTGNLLSFERWGKYKLPYQVRRNDYAVYFLARFEFPNEKLTPSLEEVKALCAVKLHDIVMRHMVHALELEAPLTYQRPRSLEEVALEQENAEFAPRESGNYQARGNRREGRGENRQYRSSGNDSERYTSKNDIDDEDLSEKLAE